MIYTIQSKLVRPMLAALALATSGLTGAYLAHRPAVPVARLTATAGTVYTIQSRLSEIDWNKLQPGDTVQIPWRSTPYAERVVIGARGTADQWINVVGLPGPNGERPVITGENATTDPQFALGYPPLEAQGLVSVWKTLATGNTVPGYVEIKNLEIRGAKTGSSFTGADGTKKQWSAASGIYALSFDHLKITGCIVTDCDQGIFTGDSQPCNDITIDGNTITGNGVVGSDQYHNTYVQCAGATYTGNRYGPLRPGANGGALKDRSADVLIDGNTIEASARCIDLSGWQNETALRAARPNATRSQILNNILINRSCVDLVYVEGRVAPDGTGDRVQFGNNTVVVRIDQSKLYYNRLFRSEYSAIAQFAASGNLLDFAPATAGASPPDCRVFDSLGTLTLGPNWSRGPVVNLPAGTTPPTVGNIAPGYTNESVGDYSLVPGAAATGFGATSAPVPLPPTPTPDPTPKPVPVPVPVPLSIVKTERVLRVTLSDGRVLYTPETP